MSIAVPKNEPQAANIAVSDIDESLYNTPATELKGIEDGENFYYEDVDGNRYGSIPKEHRISSQYQGLKTFNGHLYLCDDDLVSERNQESKQFSPLLRKPGRGSIWNFFVTKDNKVIEIINDGSITENNREVTNTRDNDSVTSKQTSDGWYIICAMKWNLVNLKANGKDVFDEEFTDPRAILRDKIDMNNGIIALPIYGQDIQIWNKTGKINDIAYEWMIADLKITDEGDVLSLTYTDQGKTYISINGHKEELPLCIERNMGYIVKSATLDDVVIRAKESTGLFKEIKVSFNENATQVLVAQEQRMQVAKSQESLLTILNQKNITPDQLQELIDDREKLIQQTETIERLKEQKKDLYTKIDDRQKDLDKERRKNRELETSLEGNKTLLEEVKHKIQAILTKEENKKWWVLWIGASDRSLIKEYKNILARME